MLGISLAHLYNHFAILGNIGTTTSAAGPIAMSYGLVSLNTSPSFHKLYLISSDTPIVVLGNTYFASGFTTHCLVISFRQGRLGHAGHHTTDANIFNNHHVVLGTNETHAFVAQAKSSGATSLLPLILSSLNHCIIFHFLSIDNNKSLAVTPSGAFSAIFLKSVLVKYVLLISTQILFFFSRGIAFFCGVCGLSHLLITGAGTLPNVNLFDHVWLNQGIHNICCDLLVTSTGFSGVPICAIL
jgi:hypothetical protein